MKFLFSYFHLISTTQLKSFSSRTFLELDDTIYVMFWVVIIVFNKMKKNIKQNWS